VTNYIITEFHKNKPEGEVGELLRSWQNVVGHDHLLISNNLMNSA